MQIEPPAAAFAKRYARGEAQVAWCTLVAEARSHDDGKLSEIVQSMQDAVTFAAGVAECEVETRSWRSYRAYRFPWPDHGPGGR